MGGGNFVVPAQTVPDFLANKLSGNHKVLHFVICNFVANLPPFPGTSLPPSSYRMGVRASNLHELFPSRITEALQHSILMFNKEVCIANLLFVIIVVIVEAMLNSLNWFDSMNSATRLHIQRCSPSWCRGNVNFLC